jgi:acyl dehydratase
VAVARIDLRGAAPRPRIAVEPPDACEVGDRQVEGGKTHGGLLRDLYLDDLQVGQRFTSGSHALDEGQIISFASQFDPQPFHTDPAAAKDTMFGGLVASGWHTVAITMRLLVQGGVPIARGLVGVGAEVSWPRPTRPGDVLRVESEVVEVAPSRSRPDRGMIKVRSETLNQRDEVVQVLEARMIVPRRPPAM